VTGNEILELPPGSVLVDDHNTAHVIVADHGPSWRPGTRIVSTHCAYGRLLPFVHGTVRADRYAGPWPAWPCQTCAAEAQHLEGTRAAAAARTVAGLLRVGQLMIGGR